MSQPAHESAVVAEFTRTLVVDIPSRLAFGEGIEADQAPSVKFDNALGKTAIINRSVRPSTLAARACQLFVADVAGAVGEVVDDGASVEHLDPSSRIGRVWYVEHGLAKSAVDPS